MNDETAINIAVTSVMASALDNDTKQEVIKVLRALEEQQKGIEQLNNFIQFQRDVLEETKMDLKGAKEDYSRLLKTAEEITEQHRQEIERLKDYSQKSANVALLAELENENARLKQEIEAMTGHYHNAARQKNKSDDDRIKLKQEIERLRQENERLKAANEGLNDEFHTMMNALRKK